MPILAVQCYECRAWGTNAEMVPMLRGLFICKPCLAAFGQESREAQEARNLAVVLAHIGKSSNIGYPTDSLTKGHCCMIP